MTAAGDCAGRIRRMRSANWIAVVLLALAALLPASPAAAQERILSYESEVVVREDGSLDVTEHITVRAEGNEIRRGIYRDFPTRYRDAYGNRVRVDFEMLSVERNGQPEEWFTEGRPNGIRINTGDDNLLPVPAEYTFTLRFRTTRQLGFFEAHDELYWNAIGTGWIFPVEQGEVEVRLPEPVPVEEMRAEGYTGPQGESGEAYAVAFPAPGVARYRLTEPLAPREGLTVVLAFPKGIVTAPTGGQRVGWFLADNRGVLVVLAGFMALLVFCVRRWRELGKDPRAGVIIPRYRPPEGHGPAGLRYLLRMGYDARCFSSDVLALAVAGHLRIHRKKKLLSETWRLDRTDPLPRPGSTASAPFARAGEHAPTASQAARKSRESDTTLPAQRTLLERLFLGSAQLELKNKNAAIVSAAQKVHRTALDAEFHPRFFKRNTTSTGVAAGIAGVTLATAFLVSGGNGIPAIVLVAVLMIATVALFAHLVRAPTPEGRALIDEIEGLKLYMAVAERDELAGMPGPDEPPPLDAGRYEALLPYAVALDVEDAWTEKFTAAVGAAAAAAATSRMSWYAGRGPVTNLGEFSRAMGSSLTSQIASASTPPGSSSGSGGGGFSGGGGGGGGGGGR